MFNFKNFLYNFSFFKFDGVKGLVKLKNSKNAEYIDLSIYDNSNTSAQKSGGGGYVFDKIRKGFKFEFELPLALNCNLNCQMCNAFSPLGKKGQVVDTQSIFKDLSRMSLLVKSEFIWLRFVGGEPLLNPNVIEIVKFARKKIKNALISITTNGLLLPRQDKNFFQQLKKYKIILLLSPYPTKQLNNILSFLINNKIFFIKTVDYFTTRKLGLDPTGSQDPKYSFKHCVYNCNFLLNGKMSKCFFPELIFLFNDYFKQNLTVTSNDYIDIHSANYDEIKDFLSKPIDFCRYCVMDDPHYYKWAISKKDIKEWIV